MQYQHYPTVKKKKFRFPSLLFICGYFCDVHLLKNKRNSGEKKRENYLTLFSLFQLPLCSPLLSQLFSLSLFFFFFLHLLNKIRSKQKLVCAVPRWSLRQTNSGEKERKKKGKKRWNRVSYTACDILFCIVFSAVSGVGDRKKK